MTQTAGTSSNDVSYILDACHVLGTDIPLEVL